MTQISIYVDEAGDLGFKEKSSEFFTVGYAFTVDRLPTKENRVIKKLLKNVNVCIKNQRGKISEFKFSGNTDYIKRKVLRMMQKLDVNIGIICISKDSVKPDLKENFCTLYSFIIVDSIVTLMVNEYLEIHDPWNSICLTIDKRLPKSQIKLFNEYCRQKTLSSAHSIDSKMNVQITINHEDSQRIPMLQVADYIASATQRKITQCDSTYYDMISSKIKHQKKWDKNNRINLGEP